MRRVGAVLFDDFEMLDLYGPLEMFAMHRDDFAIVPIGVRTGTFRASGGPDSVATTAFSDASGIDIILVPGGSGTRVMCQDQEFLNGLTSVCDGAEIVSSVCTGSLLLARAGLLKRRKATTNKRAYSWVVDQTDGVDWQSKARWVVDGNRYTSSGVSAGMDMALAIIQDLIGEKAAQDAAMWAEYTWNRDADNDPFAKDLT